MNKLTTALVALAFPLALAACTVPADEGLDDDGKTPGATNLNHDENVACVSTDECGDGEVCEDGICQMARCVESYDSSPPMGINRYFGTDGEFAVISDNTWVDAFEGSDGTYINSWDLSAIGGQVVDVAGGNLTGLRPHSVAVAVEFSDVVQIRGPGGMTELNIGIWPKALAAGDVDGDSIDELIAFGEDGTIVLCQVDTGECSAAGIDGVTGKDVAVADVDGDGYDEPMFLIDYQGSSEVIVWNTDAEITGQDATFGWGFNFPIVAISAGVITPGAPAADLVMLEDGGWWGWSSDKLHVFNPASESFTAQVDINGHTLDIAAGDRNSDDVAEIAVLRDDKQIELMSFNGAQLTTTLTVPVTVGDSAQRISFVDWDGDSASGRLVEGPELIAGRSLPIAALMFPPYPAGAAVGALSANITLGDTESSDESMSDTVSLSVGMGVSFGAEAFGFKAKVGGYFNSSVSQTKTVTKSFSAGARYWILAQPDLHGTSYAPVVMSCGCYHRYRYQTEDPAGLIGGSGQVVDIFAPVGGQTQLWSSLRYNAMADAVGTLPKIEVPIRVGDEKSYPTTELSIDGWEIDPDDMVFPETPSYQVSDVGFVSFWLIAGETVTNEVAQKTTLGAKGSLGAGIVGFDTDVSVGVSQGYSVSVGNSTLFAGGIPPVPDDPNTPEDEFEVFRYSFHPYVYRQKYVDAFGEEAGYYVLHFSVSK
jgi:hypothetical protein